MKVTIDRLTLLETVKNNLKDHDKIFNEALEGYRVQAIAYFEEQLKAAKKNKPIPHYYSFVQPENHSKDYRRVISMLENTNDNTIELSEQDYAQYVQDEWGWKKSFLTNNSYYSVSASSALNDEDEDS